MNLMWECSRMDDCSAGFFVKKIFPKNPVTFFMVKLLYVYQRGEGYSGKTSLKSIV